MTQNPFVNWVQVEAVLVLLVLMWQTPSSLQAIKHKPAQDARAYPASVLITARNAASHKVAHGCGVLLSSHSVLTAAHCVEGFDTWDVTVPYAVMGLARGHSRTAVIHPDHRENALEHDLAVLTLAQPINLGSPLPRLPGGALCPLGTRLVVVGRSNNGVVSDTQLFKAATDLAPFPGDLQLYGAVPRIVEAGDSGGPVFLAGRDQELVAVISGKLDFGRANVPTDRYVPLDAKHKKWIVKQLTGTAPGLP